MVDKDIPPHRILGIDKNASLETIKKKYKCLVKQYHPDKFKGNTSYANEQFSRIDSAYKKMISPEYKDYINNIEQQGVFFNNGRNRSMNQMRPIYQPPSPQVLCNGTVLMRGGLHPSQMTYETLQQLRRNIR